MTITSLKKDVNPILEAYDNGTYLENNLSWHIEDSPWKANQISAILNKNGIIPNTVCEVGCGAGEILKQLSGIYPESCFTGYELSSQALELCRNRTSDKINFVLGELTEDSLPYDCLLCIDVFEHVEDYIKFIKSLKNKAKYKIFHIPLDISVLSVIRSTMMTRRKEVGHLHYFSKETAVATLEHCGYELVDSFYTTCFKDIPSKTIKARIANIPRNLIYYISPKWSARLFGGCSYLILAK
jgi:ubiquinone/menaquinone biosynthesis C-methylase UbiE